MSQGTANRIVTLVFSWIGVLAGLLCAVLILEPVGQCLIDSDDDDVVFATFQYFTWAAGAFCLACGAGGAAVGYMVGRSVARDDWPARWVPPGESIGEQGSNDPDRPSIKGKEELRGLFPSGGVPGES
jgi:hypothetical protein